MFFDPRGNFISVVGIGIHGIYEVYARLVVALELIPWSGAELQNFTMGDLDQGGNNGGILEGDEAVG
jgi:hypothetical protein